MDTLYHAYLAGRVVRRAKISIRSRGGRQGPRAGSNSGTLLYRWLPPLLLIAILFRVMDSYKIFDQAYALNISGNVNQVLSIYLYNMAFNDFNTGKSSALGYIMLVVIIALANMLIRVLNNLKAEEA